MLSLPPNQISDAVIALNEDLLAIARWCCTNSPVINPDKTKLLVIGVPQITRNLPSFSPVKLLGKKFKPVLVAKDLGVIIDSSLSYNEHVTKTVSDCRHRLIRINRIKHLDRKTLLLLIDASVFSKLFYIVPSYEAIPLKQTKKIVITSELCRQDSSWSPEV